MNAPTHRRLVIVSWLVASSVGCAKTQEKPTTDPAPVATFQIQGTPQASAPASTAAGSSTPSPSTSVAQTPTTSATTKDPTSGKALKAATTKIAGKNFALDVASPGCRVNENCAMTIRLSVLGDYHVNKEYPYKFVATGAPEITYLGEANTFSKASGDFKEEGEKVATMTVRFKPSAKGEAKVSGTYKMSVCSAENCQIEQPVVTLAVPVM